MTDGSPRILVIKLRYLGDVLLTTPVFEALRSRFPNAFIGAVVTKGTEDMLTGNPSIDRIFAVERDSRLRVDLQKQFRLIGEIRNAKFDVVLELTHNDRAAVLAFLSGAKKRLGYKPKRKTRFRRTFLLTDLIAIGTKLHVIDRHLELARALGCSVLPTKPSLYWNPQDQRSCEELLQSHGVSGNSAYPEEVHDIIQGLPKHPEHRRNGHSQQVSGYSAFGKITRHIISIYPKIGEA